MGGKRPPTLSSPARYEEAATNGATSAAEVAQTAQEQGLPDLDHARYFSEVSAAVSVAIIAAEISSRIHYLVRALV